MGQIISESKSSGWDELWSGLAAGLSGYARGSVLGGMLAGQSGTQGGQNQGPAQGGQAQGGQPQGGVMAKTAFRQSAAIPRTYGGKGLGQTDTLDDAARMVRQGLDRMPWRSGGMG